MKKPKLGQRVRAKDQLARKMHHNGRKEWVRYVDYIRRAKPIEGIYIGCRTYQNGRTMGGYHRDDPLYFEPDGYVSVWLIVRRGNENPVPVLPEDVEVIE
jgi:hypothetical protein